MQFCSSIGVSTVPNMLVSEMFPFKYVADLIELKHFDEIYRIFYLLDLVYLPAVL